jgi:photosystem II stability/assembly factor-like uncharacterized protein
MRHKMLTLFFGAFTACSVPVLAGSTEFFAASDSGLFRKSSLDSPWTQVRLDSAGNAGFVATQGPHVLVLHTDVHTTDRGFLSHDGGSTWARVEFPWRTVDALYATDSGFFAHRWDGAWVSHDFGEHWQVAKEIITGLGVGGVPAAVDGNVLAVCSYSTSGFVISLDAGRHWFHLPERKRREGVPHSILPVGNNLWVDNQIWNPVTQTWREQQMPAGNLVALAKHGDRIFAATDAGIFHSDTVGQAWTKALIDSGSPVIREVPQFLEREDIGWVRRFFFRGDTGYVMMNGVLIVSTDKGATWMGTGEPPRVVSVILPWPITMLLSGDRLSIPFPKRDRWGISARSGWGTNGPIPGACIPIRARLPANCAAFGGSRLIRWRRKRMGSATTFPFGTASAWIL